MSVVCEDFRLRHVSAQLHASRPIPGFVESMDSASYPGVAAIYVAWHREWHSLKSIWIMLCILDILKYSYCWCVDRSGWRDEQSGHGIPRWSDCEDLRSVLLTSFDMWYNRGHYLHALQHSAWQHGRARFQRLRLLGEYQGNSGYSDVIGSVGHSWPRLGSKKI